MGPLADLMQGFVTAATPMNLLMCFAGVLLGQIIGVLPGIGPSAAIALLLPLTYGASPTGAIIMFAGLYYGAQYGGTLTSVLINVPGESSSVMTSIDGYKMATQGRGGVALGIAAIGSFIAGTFGTLGLMLLAPPLAKVALAFGPPEYCMLVLLGLTALAAVGGSVLKGLAAGVAGLLLGTIGIDPQVGVPRFYFGQSWLLDGVDFIILTVALFGIGEVLASCYTVEGRSDPQCRPRAAEPRRMGAGLEGHYARHRHRIPHRRFAGCRRHHRVLCRLYRREESREGSLAFRQGRDRGRGGTGGLQQCRFGRGDGARCSRSACPVPAPRPSCSARLIMFGLRPGPEMFTTNSALVWAVIASMYIGNLLLLIMNLPLAGLFARLLQIRYSWIYPPILAICVTGVISHANNVEDAWLMLGFGVVGWLMKRYDWPAAPDGTRPGARPAVREHPAPVADALAWQRHDLPVAPDCGGPCC